MKNKPIIQPEELRLGNVFKCRVSNDAALYRVRALDGMNHKVMLDGARWGTWYTLDKLRPLPLTSKLLEKYGFALFKQRIGTKDLPFDYEDYRRGNFVITMHGKNRDKYSVEFATTWQSVDQRHHVVDEMTYLHQLQNIYFALTGEELEVAA